MSTRLSNTLDRPPSEQLADLHIYVIPGDSWNEKFRSAYNEVINESVSAGFVRIHPEITVYSLREEIEEQLGYDVLPKDYIFLKSVGRCLTQVKGRQEVELKVKNFLPPHAYLPEIFVLPGQRDHVPLALPSIDSFKSPRNRGADTDRYTHPDAHNSSPDPFSIEYPHKSPMQEENKGEYLPPLSCTPPQTPEANQSESPSQRKTKVPVKDTNRSGRSDTYTNNTNEDSGIADDVEEELERKRREQEEEERRRREDQQRLRRLEEERRNEQRRLQEAERRRREEEEAESRQRLEDVERQTRDRLRQQEEERMGRERDELERQRQQLARLQDEQRDRERREQDRREQEEMAERQRELEDQMREEEERKRREEERRKQELLDKQRKAFPSPPDRVSNKRADTDSAKGRVQEEKERLLDELQRARDERQDMEKEREDLVKKAKSLQTKTQQRRNRARDAWKKKYFEEKKKTPPLEQQVISLKHKLDVEHKKYINQIEGKEARRKNMYQQPSEKTNMKVQIAKFQHDLEELRRRVENTKMKLTTEMKLRNQAETELRALRAELTQKKINVTLSRSQQLRALQESEGNMSFASPRSPLPIRQAAGLSPRIQ